LDKQPERVAAVNWARFDQPRAVAESCCDVLTAGEGASP